MMKIPNALPTAEGTSRPPPHQPKASTAFKTLGFTFPLAGCLQSSCGFCASSDLALPTTSFCLLSAANQAHATYLPT